MLKQFCNKKLFSPTIHQAQYSFNTSQTTEFIIPSRFQAPYNSLYNIVGQPNLSIEEGEKYFQWYLNNQMVESINHKLNENGEIIDDQLVHKTPDFASIKFESDKISPHDFLIGNIEKECYTSARIQSRISTAPTNQLFYWNPELLLSYEEVINNENYKTIQVKGPQKIGKSFNLIFYTLLSRLYRNNVCKVLLLSNPKVWHSLKNPIPLLIRELQMTFGEELTFSNHPLHEATIEIFKNIFSIGQLKEVGIEDKAYDIMIEVKKILNGRKLYYFQDQSEVFSKYLSEKSIDTIFDEDMINLRQAIQSNCDKNIQVGSMNDEPVYLQNKKPEKKYIFCKIPKETGRFMINTTRNAQMLTYQQASEVLDTIGPYPGQIGDFAKERRSINITFQDALSKFQENQVKNIKKDFDSFIEQNEEDDLKDIEDSATKIANQLNNQEDLILDSAYTDLRYFQYNEESKEGVPLFPAVSNFYKKYFSTTISETNKN